MIVIPPYEVSSIASSTLVEPDATLGEVAWVSAASYTAGNRVIRTTTHKVYEALSTHTGRSQLPEVDTVYWFEVGPTNKWAMLDYLRNTSSTIPSGGFSMTLELNKRVNAIAVMGAQIPDITITVTSATGGGTVYGPTTFEYKTSILVLNIPPYIDAVITVSSVTAGSVASIVCGTAEEIGYTQKGHTNDAINFSIISRDTFGNSVLVPRRSVPKTYQKILIRKNNLANVLRLRESLNAIPAVWSGLVDSSEGYFESLLILGVYKELSITIDNQEYLSATLELEEL